MAGRPKGTPKTGGRQKGTANKKTMKLRNLVLRALGMAGGVEYLKTQAEENPKAFLALLGKMLIHPIRCDEPGGEPGQYLIQWKR